MDRIGSVCLVSPDRSDLLTGESAGTQSARFGVRTRPIAVVILCALTNRLADLRPLIPAATVALGTIAPGAVIRIES